MVAHYHKPNTVQEALSLKRKLQGKAVFLAGGTFVNSMEFPRQPEHVVSLEALGLDGIERAKSGLVLGARCTLQQLIEARQVPAPLKAAVSQVASRNIRNAATLGGHLACRLACSDLAPMLMALEARVVLAGAGAARTIPVADYVASDKPGLILRILIPTAPAKRAAACCNFRASANTRSVLSVAVSVTPGRLAGSPVIAVAGVAPRVVRLTSVEEALDGKPWPSTDELAQLVSRRVKPASTPFESAAFRKYQAGVLVALAFRRALGREGGRE
jgi:putative selenate reductase FAD-binding subunit